jgi:hypothetical protein
MKRKLNNIINGYEDVIKGEVSGRDYLLELLTYNNISDEEMLYIVYAAADIIQFRKII